MTFNDLLGRPTIPNLGSLGLSNSSSPKESLQLPSSFQDLPQVLV